MHDLLERNPKQETLPQPSTGARLARAALKLLEIIPHPSKRVAEKPVHGVYVDSVDTGRHHIENTEADLTVEKLQAHLAAEAKWNQEFNALLPKTSEDRKQVIYELARKDPNILVAPEPETTSKVISFTSKDEALLSSIHKDQ